MSLEQALSIARHVLTEDQIDAVVAASYEPTPRKLIEIERGLSPLAHTVAAFLSMSVRGVGA